MTLIGAAIKIAQTVYKHRQTIVKVITAQDKYISTAWKAGGYHKATIYGIRTGAGAGALIGSLLSNQAEDSPGNGSIFPGKDVQQPTPYKSYKTRSRYSTKRFTPLKMVLGLEFVTL